MTQEKDLLIKDLCARLPYGVQVAINGRIEELCKISQSGYCQLFSSDKWFDICEIKPYLFPPSSMTKKQKKELKRDLEDCVNDDGEYVFYEFSQNHSVIEYFDWFIARHFDIRGLLDKGLAIDATGLNIY